MHTYHKNLLFWHGLLGLALSSACSPPGACSSSGTISGQVINYTSGNAVLSALVVLQKGGINSTAANPTAANTNYDLALSVDNMGNYSGTVNCGQWGVHGYAEGFNATAVNTYAGLPLSLGLVANDANALLPTLSAMSTQPATPPRGGNTSITINVQAQDPNDPLTDQVLLINTATNLVLALTPPTGSVAAAAGTFANGVWQQTFIAPSIAGIYPYALLAVTQTGNTSIVRFNLDVLP